MKNEAPKHLRPETRRWWRTVIQSYELEPHHLKLLTACAEAWDRMQEARETLARDGAYYRNRFSEPRPHPALAVERDSKTTFARMLRELRLDVPVPDDRPPQM